MTTEHRLTDKFTISQDPDPDDADAVGHVLICEGHERMFADLGTRADVRALGLAMLAWADNLASPPALTVGAALRWTHAAEYMAPTRDGDTGETCWCQAAGESWRFWRPAPSVGAPRWSSWTRGVPAEDLAAPCRTVPLAEADLDPATRGGL